MTTEKQQVTVTDKNGSPINLYKLFNIDPTKVDAVAQGWSIKVVKK